MSAIPIQQAKPVFTQGVMRAYEDMPRPTDFLRGFFPAQTYSTKTVSIEVRRNTELISVDVLRGTAGQENEVSQSSEKVWLPPFHRQRIDATSIDLYDVAFGMGSQVDSGTLGQFITKVTEELRKIQDKIERSYELQCAQVLFDGIVQIAAGVNINFRRKAASLVDLGAGNYWDVATVDPRIILRQGAEFLRAEGKVQTGPFNIIMGADAYDAFVNNPFIKEMGEFQQENIDLITLGMPGDRQLGVGGVPHGTVAFGSYKARIWTYPELYQDKAKQKLKYIPDNKFVMLPQVTDFEFSFGAVPKVWRDASAGLEFPAMIGLTQGQYVLGNAIDEIAEAWYFDVKSSGLAVPRAVDQMFTGQVLA